MIMRPDVVHDALEHALSMYESCVPILIMSPSGKKFDQSFASRIMTEKPKGLILLCGRYEGIDERVLSFWRNNHSAIELSIGDYVLFGGELPALVVSDACLRLISGIMNNSSSVSEDSFSEGLLEHSQYTRPFEWKGFPVPETLISGHHEKIRKWKRNDSIEKTKENRPDLIIED
jgi:tRNA (guanine37-N1)-methyltransferase